MHNASSAGMVTAAWGLIAVYMAVTIALVIAGARKIKSMNDYAIGSVAFSPTAVGLSLAAAMTSAATFVINPGFIAYYGLSGFISYGIVLPLASMTSLVFLTLSFRKHGSTVKALTMAQWMGSRYNSKAYSLFFAFLALLLITFIVLICVGLTKVLAQALHVPEPYMLAGIVVFVFGYMMFGGANSMVYTNMVQALIMLVVAFILLGSGYRHFSDGVHGFISKLTSIDPNLASPVNPGSFLFRDYFEIIFSQLVIGFAIICQPHIITKSLLLKDERDVQRYLTVAVLVQTIFFLVVFAGLYARLAFPALQYNGKPIRVDNIIPLYVVTEFPVYAGLLVVLGLISAGISTLEGLIQSVSTTITMDIIKPLFGRNSGSASGSRDVFINKAVIACTGAAALYLSYGQLVSPNLSVGIFAQNGVYAYFSAALVPILFGMFFKDVKAVSVITASVIAVAVHFTMFYGNVQVPFTLATGQNPGVAAAVAVTASLASGMLLHVLTRERHA